MNIFLVEDEPWALAELVALFKRYEPKHTIYSFENGDDAYAELKNVRPHLAISDITMPGMDGLEFINKVMELDPSIKCIILSVHDQFEYAQQGLKMGVCDYLLKPIKKEQLYKTIDSVIASIESETIKREEEEMLSITKLLYTTSEEENEHYLFSKPYYLVSLIIENWKGKTSWQDTNISKEEMKSYLAMNGNEKGEIFCLDYDGQCRILLIPILDKSNQSTIEKHIKRIFEHLKNKVTVHVSYLKKNEYESIATVFDLVNKKLVDHMRFGQSTYIPPETVKDELDLTNIWVKIRVIETLILKGELLKIKGIIYSITSQLKLKSITMLQLKLLINNIHYALKYRLKENLGSNTDIESIQVNLDTLDTFSTFEELADWLEEIILRIAEHFTPTLIEPKNLIPKVIQWIHSNYQQNPLFQDFANEHHVSLSYLSREFKTQTGCTFSEYIMRYRIEKAKEFFSEGLKRTSEVSSLVGYDDPKHFSSVFKRIEGISPKDFKKTIQYINH
ncbi:response regulator [Evansella sp. AB-P1]|uniref:response regulator transcription factor n=1 Tax=Evansella sp. AB-P1 TaxID=3037653 RepID=UPI00241FD022|nr:response regulator [Evansella sp. AB-P1]MDG5788492.1 response regulator [Evansella sp. AB-P1]